MKKWRIRYKLHLPQGIASVDRTYEDGKDARAAWEQLKKEEDVSGMVLLFDGNVSETAK